MMQYHLLRKLRSAYFWLEESWGGGAVGALDDLRPISWLTSSLTGTMPLAAAEEAP